MSEQGSWKRSRLRRKGRSGAIFGFQHEDYTVEQDVLRRTQGERALCICSGGEVALALLVGGATRIVAVDLNPSQLELFRLKLNVIRSEKTEYLTSMLDSLGAFDDRLSPIDIRLPLQNGVCFSGEVEERTIRLGPLLRWFAKDPALLRWRLGWKLIPLTVRIGYAAVYRRYLPAGWCERMKARVERVIEEGGSLWWSVELGEKFGRFGNSLYDEPLILSGGDRIELRNTGIDVALTNEDGWDVIALSNVIDTMSEDEREKLIRLAFLRVREGGRIVVRSMIFPPQMLPAIDGLKWEELPEDRGPICPVIGVGTRY